MPSEHCHEVNGLAEAGTIGQPNRENWPLVWGAKVFGDMRSSFSLLLWERKVKILVFRALRDPLITKTPPWGSWGKMENSLSNIRVGPWTSGFQTRVCLLGAVVFTDGHGPRSSLEKATGQHPIQSTPIGYWGASQLSHLQFFRSGNCGEGKINDD